MICHSLPYTTDAAHYYAALHDLPWSVWLDSGARARFDILTAAPQHTLSLPNITPLRDYLGERCNAIADIPFCGGALGYWSYDLGNTHSDDLNDMCVGIYDWALVIDHQLHKAQLVSQQRFAETTALIPQLLQRLQNPPAFAASNFQVHGEIHSNFTADSYAAAFAQVQHYLHAGDCYQINLAQRFHAAASGDALGAYLRLRQHSPAPYAAFLNYPHAQILSASPECFLRLENGKVTTKPIKGTRPRSADATQDAQLASALRHHPKDRAENLMIVDLLRNDLNKNCLPGSVQVPKLFEIESYSNVHHLVSTVEGQLAAGRDAIDVLRDSFPGGSITGAPKRRAMQIIQQLEPNARGLYCGAIGYIGFDGNMETNIAIRTLVYHQQQIRCWAGGGIVADSVCQAEYQETFDKAAGMLKLLQQFGGQLSA